MVSHNKGRFEAKYLTNIIYEKELTAMFNYGKLLIAAKRRKTLRTDKKVNSWD
jgi:hypothetical protein